MDIRTKDLMVVRRRLTGLFPKRCFYISTGVYTTKVDFLRFFEDTRRFYLFHPRTSKDSLVI